MNLIWFVLIAIIAIVIIRSLRHHEWYRGQGGASAKNDPLDIAKERYAKGEITKDEFEQLKKDLK